MDPINFNFAGFQLVVALSISTLLLSVATTHAASPQRHHQEHQLSMISMKSGLSKVVNNRLESALEWASLEQIVEDRNAHIVATAPNAIQATCARCLICLPLDEGFDPPMGVFSHGHVQTGDKMSLPRIFWNAIQSTQAEVPWLFEVTPCMADIIVNMNEERKHTNNDGGVSSLLERVVGGALDFRAPPNYVFLPWWMMRSMGLAPRDVVDVRLIQTVPAGSAVQLRPHSSKFASTITNPQAVLETELKHYSALTKGSSIAFDYNGERYWFDVVDLRSAPRGERVPWTKVQDCDIAAEFVPAKDSKKKRKPKDE